MISTQVVTKLVQQMMEKAGDGDQEGLLAALAGQEGIPGMAPGCLTAGCLWLIGISRFFLSSCLEHSLSRLSFS